MARLKNGGNLSSALKDIPGGGGVLDVDAGAVIDVPETVNPAIDGLTIRQAEPGPRPLFRCKKGLLFLKNRKRFFLIGINATSADPGKYDCITAYNALDFTISASEISGFKIGVVVQMLNGTPPANVEISYNNIHHNYPAKAYQHAHGVYCASVTGYLRLIGNVFDANGWLVDKVAGWDQNHNVYLQSTNCPATVKGNIFANASSHGLQCRPGGDVEQNVFYENPVGMSYGNVNGAPVHKGGVSGKVRSNLFVGDGSGGGYLKGRGWALELGNILNAEVIDNIFAHGNDGISAAIQVNKPQRMVNPADICKPNIKSLTIDGNLVVDWKGGDIKRNTSDVGIIRTQLDSNPDKITADFRKVIDLKASAASMIEAAGKLAKRTVPVIVKPPATVDAVMYNGSERIGSLGGAALGTGGILLDEYGLVAEFSEPVDKVSYIVDGVTIRSETFAPFSLGGDTNGIIHPVGNVISRIAGAVKVSGAGPIPVKLTIIGQKGGAIVAQQTWTITTGSDATPEPLPEPPPVLTGVERAIQAARAADALLPGEPAKAKLQIGEVLKSLA